MGRTRLTILFLAAVLAGILLVALGARRLSQPYAYRGSLIDPPLPAAAFSLEDQQGKPFRLQDQRGQVVLLFFGYTSCPDVCPATLAQFKLIHDRLEEGLGDQVRFVLITVDPDRDTPARLANYLARFDPSFIGLTGSLAGLQPVWEAYFVYREVPHDHELNHYLVDHTSRVYVIDQSGGLRLTFPFGMEVDDMLADIRYLLADG